MGFGNFYRRFIRDYSKIARPLTELTKKTVAFNWTPACQKAFDTLKNAFMAEPVLCNPDPTQPFQVECDASKVATGAVLRQQTKTDSGTLVPICRRHLTKQSAITRSMTENFLRSFEL